MVWLSASTSPNQPWQTLHRFTELLSTHPAWISMGISNKVTARPVIGDSHNPRVLHGSSSFPHLPAKAPKRIERHLLKTTFLQTPRVMVDIGHAWPERSFHLSYKGLRLSFPDETWDQPLNHQASFVLRVRHSNLSIKLRKACLDLPSI